jgi:hypothetical protein
VTKGEDTSCLSALEIIPIQPHGQSLDPVKNAIKGHGINDISVSYLNSGLFEN